MNPGRRFRIAAAMTALASYAACGDQPTEQAQPEPTTTTEAPNAEPDVVWLEDVDWHALRMAATTTTQRASRSVSRPRPNPPDAAPSAGGGDVRTVSSTAYCLTGTMANGQRVYRGAVAMNGVPMGSRWEVVETGAVYTVADRIGHGSGFDIWMASCDEARKYGRRTVVVRRVR